MSKLLSFPLEVRSGSVVVKIYRVRHKTAKDGFAYTVAWVGPNGRETAQFGALERAKDEAALKADQLAKGLAESEHLTRGDVLELAEARRLVGNVPLRSALEEWARARELVGPGLLAACERFARQREKENVRVKLKDALDQFLAEKTASNVGTAVTQASVYKRIREDLGEYFMDTLSEKVLSDYLLAIRHPVSRNTRRKRLVTLFRWCQTKRYLPRDVRSEIEYTATAKEGERQIGIITVDTMRALLLWVRQHQQPYLATAVVSLFCGLRRDEVHNQQWSDINLRERFLTVTRAKANTPAQRHVPLSKAAVAWLRVCEPKEGAICSNLGVDRLRKHAIAAGFALPANCFRHAYISHRVAETKNIPATALDAGNSVDIIFKHYRRLVSEKDGAAWFDFKPPAARSTARRQPGRIETPAALA